MDRSSFDQLFDMTGRTVIVTGGTRGIGLALAEGYVLAGARVVVASRKADACERAAQHLRDLGAEAIGVPTHLGDVDDLGALVGRTVSEFGGVDVLVNNAATPIAQPFGQLTVDALTKSFEVNLRGPVFLVQEALPHLKASPHAAVLNMVSIGAFIFAPMLSIYASMKAAMMSFTRSMAAEFADDGIRVNASGPRPGGHRHDARGGEERVETPGVEQGALPVVAAMVEVGDAAYHQPARDLLAAFLGAERGEPDLGDLGPGDPPLGRFVVNGVGVLDRNPGPIIDGGDGGADFGVQAHRDRHLGAAADRCAHAGIAVERRIRP